MITTVLAFLASNVAGLAMLGGGGGIAGWVFRAPVKRWVKKHPLLVVHLIAAVLIVVEFGIEQWRIGTRDDTISEQAKTLDRIKDASAALDARLKAATDEITRRNVYRAKMLAAAKAAAAKDPTANDPLPPLIERALREEIR